MKNRYNLVFTVLVSMFLFAAISTATAEEGVGFGVKAGTLGGGVELSASLIENTRIRGGFNYLTFSFDSTISDINYDFENDFNSLSLLLDWHPFGSSFFLSGGVYFNNNSISVDGTVDGSIIASEISRLVSLSGNVEFQPVAPYAGLGWRSNNAETGWGIALDMGVLFQGAPDVTDLRLNAPIDVSSIADLQSFLAEQEEEIEDELSWFQYYPVVSLMLTYNF